MEYSVTRLVERYATHCHTPLDVEQVSLPSPLPATARLAHCVHRKVQANVPYVTSQVTGRP